MNVRRPREPADRGSSALDAQGSGLLRARREARQTTSDTSDRAAAADTCTALKRTFGIVAHPVDAHLVFRAVTPRDLARRVVLVGARRRQHIAVLHDDVVER